MDKNSGRHRLTAVATLPDLRKRLTPPASRVIVCVVKYLEQQPGA
ncbi:hypothetical protein [Mesorhizobium sp. M0159]